MTKEDSGPLHLSEAEMRDLGYRVIDVLVEHFTHGRDEPVAARPSREELERRLREPVPETGMPCEAVLTGVLEDILGHITHTDHPRFFAYVPSPTNFVSVMADTLASGYNVFAGHWLAGAGAAQTELVTIDWLRQLVGYPDTASGLFVSGGSMANLTALVAARHTRLGVHREDAIVYRSDQTHASVRKGLSILGFEPEQLRLVPTDARGRLRVGALRETIRQDRTAGWRPFCLIANAGTTSTGAVDPLEELATLSREEELWLHVDGAYGAAAVLCDDARGELKGLERADSITLDPHKWWFQPYEIGCLLVRDGKHLTDTFGTRAEYLEETRQESEEVNFYDYGMQLTRSFRALKLWMSLKAFGLAAFRKAVDKGLRLAEEAEGMLREDPIWDIVTPAQLGIVTFRYRPSALPDDGVDAITHRIVARLIADGFAMVTTTVLDGRPVLRLCPIHPEATQDDVRETIARLKRFGDEEALLVS